MDFIYLDSNATTPMLPAVGEAMRPFLTEVYGNPASAHRAGSRARLALEDAREQTASILGAYPDELIFTSGATESNNLALFGLAGDPPGHIITSPLEHPSVIEPICRLEQLGHRVDRLAVDPTGSVRAESIVEHLRPDTRLLGVMLVNHETGAVQPVPELVDQLDGRAAFHCDAVQAVGKLPVNFHELGVSTLALSAHKFHGPKGVGALLVRRDVKLQPQLWGGHQQQGRRPGTEPVALAVGLATALAIWRQDAETRILQISRLHDLFLDRLRATAAPVVVNGPPVRTPSRGVPHTLNISFPGCQADSILMNLDLDGVACSTGSACSSGSLLPSPVLQAMGTPPDVLHSAMRFSFSALTTQEEVIEATHRIAAVIVRLRESCSQGN
jgi:cysteine desulfurase